MRILFFTTYFLPYLSGMTIYAHRIIKHLANQNKVTVLTFCHSSDLPEVEQEGNIRIVRMPYQFRLSKGFVSFSSIPIFYREVKRSEVVITSIPNGEGLPLVLLAALMKRPILSLFHCQVTLGQRLSERFLTQILRSYGNLQIRMSHRVICYTEDYIESLKNQNFNNKSIFILPPIVVDTVDAAMHQKLKDLKKGEYQIGFSGRIAREKGIELLISALMRLTGKYRIQLIFAGTKGTEVAGESDYSKYILHELNNSGLDYEFIGNLSGGRLAAFYAGIDLLVLPSRNQTEAFGLVQAESMLLGTPVVVSNLPGVRVPVRMTGMGEIVPIDSVESLAEAIERVLLNPERYASNENITRAKQIFNHEKAFREWDDVIEHL